MQTTTPMMQNATVGDAKRDENKTPPCKMRRGRMLLTVFDFLLLSTPQK